MNRFLIGLLATLSISAMAHEIGDKVILIQNSEQRYEFSIEATLEILNGSSAVISYFDGMGVFRKKSVESNQLAKTYGCNTKNICVGQKAIFATQIGSIVTGNNGISYDFRRDVELDGTIIGIYSDDKLVFSYVDGGGISHMKALSRENLKF